MMNEAVEEHHLVHVLIKELKKLKPKDEVFQAKFKVLGELVKHHIEEEEEEMLPKAQESDLDWEKLNGSDEAPRNDDQQALGTEKDLDAVEQWHRQAGSFLTLGEKQPAA